MLESVGYEVETRATYVAAERLDHEGSFDLIIVALHRHPEDTAAYSDHLSRSVPKLPILLLTMLEYSFRKELSAKAWAREARRA